MLHLVCIFVFLNYTAICCQIVKIFECDKGAFVVTSTQNHRIIHLFNIIEILNKFKISSLQISCSIWKFDKNIAGILDFLCYSLFTFFLQQTKMTIINSLKPRFHSQTMSIPFNPYSMVQPDLRLVASKVMRILRKYTHTA